MSDQVSMLFWLRGYTEHNMLRHFELLLRQFPFSRLHPRALLRIAAVDFSEPPLLEQIFEAPAEAADIIDASSQFQNSDCAYLVEAAWDLWRHEEDWSLRPSPITLSCFGPLFPSEWGEQLRVDLGPDHLFLPGADRAGGLTAVRSNIRSVLRLARDVSAVLPVEKMTIWSESGENLGDRLETALAN